MTDRELVSPAEQAGPQYNCPDHGAYYVAAYSAQETINTMLVSGTDPTDISGMLLPGEADEPLRRALETFEASCSVIELFMADQGLRWTKSLLARSRTTDIPVATDAIVSEFMGQLGRPADLADAEFFTGMFSNTLELIDGNIDITSADLSQLLSQTKLARPGFTRILKMQLTNRMLVEVEPDTLCISMGPDLLDQQQHDDLTLQIRERLNAERLRRPEYASSFQHVNENSLLSDRRFMFSQIGLLKSWHSEVLAHNQEPELDTADLKALDDSSTLLAKQLQRVRDLPLSEAKLPLKSHAASGGVSFGPYARFVVNSNYKGGFRPNSVVRLHKPASDEALIEPQDELIFGKTRVMRFATDTAHILTIDPHGDLWLGISPDKNGISLRLVHERAGKIGLYQTLRAEILQRSFDAAMSADVVGELLELEDGDPLTANALRIDYLRSHNRKQLRSTVLSPEERMQRSRRSRWAARIGESLVEEASPAEAENTEALDMEPIPPLAEAELSLELTRLLETDAFKKPLDIDSLASPLYQMIRLQGLVAKLNHVEDPEFTVITQNMVDNSIRNNAESMTLRGVQEFHTIIEMLAKHQKITTERFASSVTSWKTDEMMLALVNDFIVICKEGLLDKRCENFMLAARALKAFNLLLFMSPQGDDVPAVTQYYGTLLNALTLPDAALEDMSRRYAEFILDADTDAVAVRAIIAEAGDQADVMKDRAAQWIVLTESLRHFKDIGDRSQARHHYMEAIHTLAMHDFEPSRHRVDAIIKQLESSGVEADTIDGIMQAAQLNWEILPPGDLEKAAHGIVDDIQKRGTPVTIDLERLTALEKIREAWGTDRCFYAKGELGKRKIIRKDGKEEPDQYLILVMQEHDEYGNVLAEHAVAESPIAGPHAMYLFRQDASEGLSWREVMALPKQYARAFNTRKIMHVVPTKALEQHLPTAMAAKVELLMACTPEEFLAAEFNGERGLRFPKQAATASR